MRVRVIVVGVFLAVWVAAAIAQSVETPVAGSGSGTGTGNLSLVGEVVLDDVAGTVALNTNGGAPSLLTNVKRETATR